MGTRSWRRVRTGVAVVCIVAMAMAFAPFPALRVAHAASILVNYQSDVTDNDGHCTLREAVIAASTGRELYGSPLAGECAGGLNAVLVPPGTYTLTIAPSGDNDGFSGDLNITGSIALVRDTTTAGSVVIQASTTTSAAGIDRVFSISAGDVSLEGVTVQHGNAHAGNGGGISITGNGTHVTLTNVNVFDNRTAATSVVGGGGGIAADNASFLTVTGSTITDNTAPNGDGGGIFTSIGTTLAIANSGIQNNTALRGGGTFGGGDTTITRTLFADNIGTFAGGAMQQSYGVHISGSRFTGNRSPTASGVLLSNTDAEITNSTFDSHLAGVGSDGIALIKSIGVLALTNVTLAGNAVGIRNDVGTFSLRATLLANTRNCAAFSMFTSADFNLSSDASCAASLTGANDLNEANPLLGPLSAGPLPTYTLLAGSPAIDRGGPTGSGGCAATDQLGAVRPQGLACDIGAYESAGVRGAAPVALTLGPASVDVRGGSPVVVGGRFFLPGATATLDGTPLPDVVVAGQGRITFTAPAHAIGGASLVVTNPDGQMSAALTLVFGVVTAAPTPPRPSGGVSMITPMSVPPTRPGASTPPPPTPTPLAAPPRR